MNSTLRLSEMFIKDGMLYTSPYNDFPDTIYDRRTILLVSSYVVRAKRSLDAWTSVSSSR